MGGAAIARDGDALHTVGYGELVALRVHDNRRLGLRPCIRLILRGIALLAGIATLRTTPERS